MRIPNDTREPQVVRKNEHLCQVHLVSAEIDNSNATLPYMTVPTVVRTIGISNKPTYHSSNVKLDPDNILPSNIKDDFKNTLQECDAVFEPEG